MATLITQGLGFDVHNLLVQGYEAGTRIMAKFIQKPFVGGDWLIREDPTYEYTRSSYVVDNTGSTYGSVDIDLPAGYPFKMSGSNSVPCIATDITTAPPTAPTGGGQAAFSPVTGFLIEHIKIPFGTKATVDVLERGYNIINVGISGDPMVPLADYAGATWTLAQITAHLKAGVGHWRVLNGLAEMQEQAS